MCGFLVHNSIGNPKFIRKRGQDYVGISRVHGFTFEHYLLSCTGNLMPQPIIDGDIVCVVNGEIYNHPFKVSDCENIIPIYKKHGLTFASELDGEFAIALYDFGNDMAFFVTDRFATKPLWRNGLECASYKSGVGGRELPPNTIECIRISAEKELFRHTYHEWDWSQYKDTYDDWIKSFEQAIRKRASDRCFIGLSSGYDSGAISKELTKQGVNFKAYSILNNENESIIQERAKYCYEWDEIKVKDEPIDIEDVHYTHAQEKVVADDIGAKGLAAICKQANREGRKVCISGQGADEIIGDYRLFPKQSNFKGIFPKELRKWENFDGGLQRDYLHKEEYVGGAFSIETRYPFLDTQVVQEFLWLTPELKNKNYKAPIYEYLTRNNVPFDKAVKRGFHPF